MNEKLENGTSPYAGRWVATVQGRVVAQGGSADEARRAAERSRHKEKAEITYMPAKADLNFPPLVEHVRAVLPDEEIHLVGGAVRDALLGKLSHDLDFVVPTNAIAVARRVANTLRADFYILDQEFDAARVIVNRLSEVGVEEPKNAEDASAGQPVSTTNRYILDFTSFREVSSQIDAKTPSRAATLDADLRARDFTINAMAYDLRTTTIEDPLNGGADLRAKILRACSKSAMSDDAIRILRGIRLAAALDFKIEAATRDAMKAAANRLSDISAERQRDELFKILDGKRPDASLRAMELLGAFPYVMPELSALKGVEQSPPHVADVWEHTLSTVQHLDRILECLSAKHNPEKNNDLFTGLLSGRLGRYRERFTEHLGYALSPERSVRALLFFAALFHDVTKPQTKSIDETGRIRFLGHDASGAEVAAKRARAFNLSNGEVERLAAIIENHMRIHFHVSRLEGEGKEPSRKSIYRFFRDTGEAGVDLILLGLADLRGVRGHTLTQETWSRALDVARLFLENYWEKPEESVSPPRLIDGNTLMAEYGLEPGPIVGKLLEAIREAQATGELFHPCGSIGIRPAMAVKAGIRQLIEKEQKGTQAQARWVRKRDRCR